MEDESRGVEKIYTATLTQPFVIIISILIVVLASFGILPLFLSHENSSLAMNLIYLIPVLAVLGFCVYILLMKNTITVNDQGILIVNAGYFRKYISFAELDAVRHGPNTSLAQGIGVRVVGKRMGYLSGGATIKLILRDGAVILASTPKPAEVIDEIRSRMEHQKIALQA